MIYGALQERASRSLLLLFRVLQESLMLLGADQGMRPVRARESLRTLRVGGLHGSVHSTCDGAAALARFQA